MQIQLEKYQDHHRPALLQVWEASVRATHHFLLPVDIDFYKGIVRTIDFTQFTVYCALNPEQQLVGFLGTSGQKLEMLFLHPDFIGQGVGKKMMQFAFTNLGVTEVEVNEGNIQARQFYEKAGFTVKRRRPIDDCGKPYPILEMELT